MAAYGEVDELNATIGLARAAGSDAEIDGHLARIQDELFCVGAELATPHGVKARSAVPALASDATEELERAIDRWDAELPKLTEFVLPGGSGPGAALHLARCVCRRAERRVVALHRQAALAPNVLAYLNRLSDFLFVAARIANQRSKAPETRWDPHRRK